MATYVIGDIQGCFEEFIALLKKINFSSKSDSLWLMGDLVNRGKNSLEVLRYAKSLQQQASCNVILGNHDLHLLAVFYQIRKLKKQDTFQDVLNAEDAESLCDWLRHQSMLHFDESLQTLLCHAGIAPNWTISQSLIYARELEEALRSIHFKQVLAQLFDNHPNQLRMICDVLTRMRFCFENGSLDFSYKGKIGSQPKNLKPWFEIRKQMQKDTVRVIFGHWAALEGETFDKQYICVDTGCIWGNTLSAFRLEDKMWFQVPSSASAAT